MLSSSSAFVIGIPLRIRGARIMNHQNHMSAGNIPAYAGSTDVCIHETVFREGHPRLCGEHNAVWKNDLTEEGSSPRMRGAPTKNGIRRLLLRVIPAYAGSTDAASTCGAVSHGSPPRMRGALPR